MQKKTASSKNLQILQVLVQVLHKNLHLTFVLHWDVG